MTTVDRPTWPPVRFRPRRLGHFNLWVGELAASDAFYREVCGLPLVFDEPGIEAKFYSAGNSHHDLALMQASERSHRGRDGHEQVTGDRGRHAGLNHIAFEMATEALLVEALQRAADHGFAVAQTVDHQISRSAYLEDPDGFGVEIYADAEEPFLVTYERVKGELLTELWDPFAEAPSTAEHFVTEPEDLVVEGAPVRPHRACQVTFAVADLARSVGWYTEVVGLTVLDGSVEQGRVVLGGALGAADIVLVAADEPALQRITFEAVPGTDLAAVAAAVGSVASLDDRSLVLVDPDGLQVELVAT